MTLIPVTTHARMPRHHLTERTPPRRTLTLGHCADCGELVYNGLNEDWCAWAVRVEVWPLTWAGELAAWCSGRDTHQVRDRKLYRRCYSTRKGPAKYGPVLAEHKCGEEIPAEWKAEIPIPTISQTNEEPGF
jgi:hypothetical protein